MKKIFSIILLTILSCSLTMANVNNENKTIVNYKVSNVNYNFKYNDDINVKEIEESIINTSEEIYNQLLNLASPSQGEPEITISIEVSIGIGSTYGKTTVTVKGTLSQMKELTKKAIETAKTVKKQMS